MFHFSPPFLSKGKMHFTGTVPMNNICISQVQYLWIRYTLGTIPVNKLHRTGKGQLDVKYIRFTFCYRIGPRVCIAVCHNSGGQLVMMLEDQSFHHYCTNPNTITTQLDLNLVWNNLKWLKIKIKVYP